MLQFSQQNICSFAHTTVHIFWLLRFFAGELIVIHRMRFSTCEYHTIVRHMHSKREQHATHEGGYQRDFRCEITRCLLITLYLHCTNIQQNTGKVNAHQMGINLISMENLCFSGTHANTIVPCSFIHSVTQNENKYTRTRTNEQFTVNRSNVYQCNFRFRPVSSCNRILFVDRICAKYNTL